MLSKNLWQYLVTVNTDQIFCHLCPVGTYNDEYNQEQCKSCIVFWPRSSSMKGMTSCDGVHLGASENFVFRFLMTSLIPMLSYFLYIMSVSYSAFKYRKNVYTEEGRNIRQDFLVALQSIIPALNIVFWWWYSINSVFVDWYAFSFAALFTFCPSYGFWRLLYYRRIEIWFLNFFKITDSWIWLTCTSDGDPGLSTCFPVTCTTNYFSAYNSSSPLKFSMILKR